MRYINTKTGSIREFNGKISGEHWIPVEEITKKEKKSTKDKKVDKPQKEEVEDGKLCNN